MNYNYTIHHDNGQITAATGSRHDHAGITFYASKIYKTWRTTEEQSGSMIASGKTKKEAVGITLTLLNKHGQEATNKLIAATLKKWKAARFFHRPAVGKLFFNLFGKRLDDFMLPMGLGLDIVRLDRYIGTPDGVSMKAHLTAKYPPHAVRLVEKLNAC